MPELPDVIVYIESLEARIVGHRLERILLKNPFLLRTAEPPLQSCEGHVVTRLRRLGIPRYRLPLDTQLSQIDGVRVSYATEERDER